jgi:hypothetical protein
MVEAEAQVRQHRRHPVQAHRREQQQTEVVDAGDEPVEALRHDRARTPHVRVGEVHERHLRIPAAVREHVGDRPWRRHVIVAEQPEPLGVAGLEAAQEVAGHAEVDAVAHQPDLRRVRRGQRGQVVGQATRCVVVLHDHTALGGELRHQARQHQAQRVGAAVGGNGDGQQGRRHGRGTCHCARLRRKMT